MQLLVGRADCSHAVICGRVQWGDKLTVFREATTVFSGRTSRSYCAYAAVPWDPAKQRLLRPLPPDASASSPVGVPGYQKATIPTSLKRLSKCSHKAVHLRYSFPRLCHIFLLCDDAFTEVRGECRMPDALHWGGAFSVISLKMKGNPWLKTNQRIQTKRTIVSLLAYAEVIYQTLKRSSSIVFYHPTAHQIKRLREMLGQGLLTRHFSFDILVVTTHKGITDPGGWSASWDSGMADMCNKVRTLFSFFTQTAFIICRDFAAIWCVHKLVKANIFTIKTNSISTRGRTDPRSMTKLSFHVIFGWRFAKCVSNTIPP